MGRYEGELTATWKPDGRLMELRDPFAFIDKGDQRWDVPAGAQIDGASIPFVLWSVTGSPYTGKYRDASVVHDWFCSIRRRTSHATHAMFYEAMLVSGVSPAKAGIMYAAVRYAGPKWSMMDIHNTNLAMTHKSFPQRANFDGPGGLPEYDSPRFDPTELPKPIEAHVRDDVSEAEFSQLAHSIEVRSLDLDAIDALVAALPKSEPRILANGLYRFPPTSF